MEREGGNNTIPRIALLPRMGGSLSSACTQCSSPVGLGEPFAEAPIAAKVFLKGGKLGSSSFHYEFGSARFFFSFLFPHRFLHVPIGNTGKDKSY